MKVEVESMTTRKERKSRRVKRKIQRREVDPEGVGHVHIPTHLLVVIAGAGHTHPLPLAVARILLTLHILLIAADRDH